MRRRHTSPGLSPPLNRGGGWAFALEPIDNTSTRLITRATGEYEHFAVGLMLGLVWRPIDFGMQRRQLIHLNRRVEAAAG